jgi:hypothetical protein
LQAFGLTPSSMAAAAEKDIDALIANVGFHTKKAQFIRRTAQILLEKYGGDIPPTLEVGYHGIRTREECHRVAVVPSHVVHGPRW